MNTMLLVAAHRIGSIQKASLFTISAKAGKDAEQRRNRANESRVIGK